jgi:ABC-type amino acid transport system permease subunit
MALNTIDSRRREFLLWSGAFTLLAEAVTLLLRFGGGLTAVEFNRGAPLLLQIHHMFWAVPLLLLAAMVRRWPVPSMLLAAAALACVVSDLLHHFVVLPLLVGHTGWHWP